MTLNQFLDVAYTLLVDEYRRLGSSLSEALEQTREYAAGPKPVTASGNESQEAPPKSNLSSQELQNENAMAMLEQAMSTVGNVR